MGGNIWLTTNENVGTTVYFYLDYDMSIFNESKTILNQTEINSIKQKSFLIIDEDMGNQKYIIQTLGKYSIKAKTMPNCQFYNNFGEANKKHDLILVDYNSGFEEFLKEKRLKLLGDSTFLIIMTTTNIEEKIINLTNLAKKRFLEMDEPVAECSDWTETDVYSFLDESWGIPLSYFDGNRRVGCDECFQADLKSISLIYKCIKN